ncbi:alpha/beta hydrolase [Saccharopolyspora rhizosphaerae]|uniref:alpha/beta hydrolase n=1 Tax=Saccharopolyspora rhizosphaerae TaxID=2492662 RepID=UPI001F427033|nr:alpha/beta fold hydrolase [Saccharopolyspora rhizosphaerae]
MRAEDGTRLRGVLDPGPGLPAPLGFVVGHGFTNHIRKPSVRVVLQRLATHGPVLATDFRGHGRSGGRTTVGPNEAMDIDAAVAHLRSLGCERVVTIGFSLGGSVVLRQAALGTPPDAVISVSSPARWFVRETPAMRRVHWLLEQPHGRLAARLLGVRLAPPWPRVPISPLELVTRVEIPRLVVHGAEDHYFPPTDARALAEAGDAEFWLVEGMRHAESSTSPELVDRIVAWAVDMVVPPDRARSDRRCPDRTERAE